MYKLQYSDAETEIKRNEKGDSVGLIVKMKAKISGSELEKSIQLLDELLLEKELDKKIMEEARDLRNSIKI